MGKTMQRLSYGRRKLAIAVTLAVAAAALMVIYGAQARANGATTASGKTVLVATRDIPLGTPAVRDRGRRLGHCDASAGLAASPWAR